MQVSLSLPVLLHKASDKGEKDQQNLAKAQAKRDGEGDSEASRKIRRVRKNPRLDHSGSDETLSPAPLNHAAPNDVRDPLTVVPNDAARAVANVEKEVVDLSCNTRVTTPPATVNQSSPSLEHDDTHEHSASDANSFHSTHHEDTEEGTVDRQFVPNWGLSDDLRICTFRACKELFSHLATPTEEEFLGNLTNVKVVSRAYQSLGQCVLLQVERIKVLEEALEPKSVQLATAEGKVKVLEDEKAALRAKLDQAEKDRHKLVREFIPTVVKKLHTSIEYRQSLAAPVSLCSTAGWLGGLSLGRIEDQIAVMLSKTQDLDIEGSKLWEAKHRDLFTMQYAYVQKFGASYHLLVDELMKVSPDIPSPPPKYGVETVANDVDDATRKSPSAAQETTSDTPFGNTT
ncbi:hypothetical protein Tco_1130541 [Tanacetum coccineum]